MNHMFFGNLEYFDPEMINLIEYRFLLHSPAVKNSAYVKMIDGKKMFTLFRRLTIESSDKLDVSKLSLRLTLYKFLSTKNKQNYDKFQREQNLI